MKNKKTLFTALCIALMCTFLLPNCSSEGEDNSRPVGNVTLSIPANNATNVAVLPTFVWQAATNAEKYSLYVANNSSFTGATEYANIATTTFTLTAALSYSSTYYWKVTATGAGAGNTKTSEPFSFTTAAAPPAPVGTAVLTVPANNAVGISLTPTFQWNAAANALNYTLAVANNSGFTGAATYAVTATSYTLTSALTNGTTYYWRVTATGGGAGNITTSEAFSFTTLYPAVGTFNLTAPANNAGSVSRTPTFQWTAAANANNYTLAIANNSGFTSPSTYAVTATSYTLTAALNYATTYYWKVTATGGGAGNTYTTTAFSFITEAAPSGTPPTFTITNTLLSATNSGAAGVLLGANVVGTYATTGTGVKLVGSITETFDAGTTQDIPVSGGAFSIPKAGLPASTYIWVKVVATVSGAELSSAAQKIYTGDVLQVHNFMNTTDFAAGVAAISNDVDNGVWVMNYTGGQNFGGYARINIHNILDNAGKSISNIKAVYFKYKSTGNINQTVTYVREDANAVLFNINSIVAGSEWNEFCIWNGDLKANNAGSKYFHELDNTKANRRFSFGVNTAPNPAGTLSVKDLYFVF